MPLLSRRRQVDVLWVIEHVARELDVACAVRHLLRERGLSVEVVPASTDMQRLGGRLSPRLVVTPFFYGAALWHHLVPYFNGTTWLSLGWEQVLAPATAPYKVLRDDFARRHVLHHAWNDGFRTALLAQGVPAEHVFVNGQPAYKLYDPPYAAYFPDRQELARRHGLDPQRRWVFFPDNYGWAFRPERSFRKIEALGADPKTVADLREFHTRSFLEATRWLGRLADRGDVLVVLRPRPATAAAVFTEHVRAALGRIPPGLHVIKDGSVREWILAADTVVSSYSTTLIEAALAGRSLGMLEPFPPPEPLLAEWYRMAPRVPTCEALEEMVSGASPGDARCLGEWARRSLLGSGDPIAELASHVASVVSGGRARPPAAPAELVPRGRGALYPLVRSAFLGWRGLARAVQRQVDPARAHDDSEMDHFLPADVERRTEGWGRVLARA